MWVLAISLEAIERKLTIAWPWIWPTLALIAYLIVIRLLVRRWHKWLASRGPNDLSSKLHMSRGMLIAVERVGILGFLAFGGYLWTQTAPVSAEISDWSRTYLEPWILATVLVIALLLAALYAARRLLVWLEARAARSPSGLDDIVVEALSRPLYVTVVLLAVNLWSSMLPLPETMQRYVSRAGETTIVVLIVLFIDGLIQSWMTSREEKSKVLKTSGVVLRTGARIIAFAIGGLMALSSLGVNITPALATLGIGSAALGFALQGTVTDFLAGLMIATDQPVRVGEYIRIDDQNNQGWVLVIGWRTTRLLTRMDMEVVVPNSRLAQALFVNTSRPREDCRFHATVFLSLHDDLDHLVSVATEVAEQVQREDPRAHNDYRAFAFILEFHHGVAEMRVWLCARNYDAHFGMRDAYLRRLLKRYRELGIRLPLPGRDLDLSPSALKALSVAGVRPEALPAGAAAPRIPGDSAQASSGQAAGSGTREKTRQKTSTKKD